MRGDEQDRRLRLDLGDPRRSRTYLGILMALMAITMLGAIIAILGENVYESEAMRQGGFGIAIVSGCIYLFFRVWGRRKAEQARLERIRSQLSEDPPRDDDDFDTRDDAASDARGDHLDREPGQERDPVGIQDDTPGDDRR